MLFANKGGSDATHLPIGSICKLASVNIDKSHRGIAYKREVIIVIKLLIFSVFLTDRDHYYIHVLPRLPAPIFPVFHLDVAG